MSKNIERNPKGALKEAFLAANTVKYGPFVVEKLPGQDWGKGRLSIEGKPIPLEPRKVQIMALLIAQEGQISTPSMFALAMNMKTDVSKIAADDPLLKNLHVQLSELKKQFTEHTGTDAFKKMIEPAQSQVNSKRKDTRNPDLVGCYRLRIPAPTA